MHDLEKKLFQLEELLFLSLQTSLTKYISSIIDCNNKQQKFLSFMESNSLNQTICMKKNRILFPQKIRHTAQRRVLPAAHQTRQECIIFPFVPEFFKEIWLSYPILPEFYQNSLFCRTEKRIEFHKPRFL